MSSRQKKVMDFEKNMSELEELIEDMEEGELSLEESLAAFEKGIKLSRDCQSILKKAEQKVSVLTEENGDVHVESFADLPADDG